MFKQICPECNGTHYVDGKKCHTCFITGVPVTAEYVATELGFKNIEEMDAWYAAEAKKPRKILVHEKCPDCGDTYIYHDRFLNDNVEIMHCSNCDHEWEKQVVRCAVCNSTYFFDNRCIKCECDYRSKIILDNSVPIEEVINYVVPKVWLNTENKELESLKPKMYVNSNQEEKLRNLLREMLKDLISKT